MKRIEEAVSNSGPLIHLSQINSFKILNLFETIYIPQEVFNEVTVLPLPGAKEIKESKFIRIKYLGSKSKDYAKIISERYSLGLGESESIALAIQEKVKLFVTDDLAARLVAKSLGLKPHGTVGIVLRAYKLELIRKEQAIKIVTDLYKNSSLFLTIDLVRYIVREI